MPPNFALLDVNRPEVARLIAAMVQARDAVERRSWAHLQEPTSEAWAVTLEAAGDAAPQRLSFPTRRRCTESTSFALLPRCRLKLGNLFQSDG